jgi:acyl-CoA synthetase (NDP forming)
MKDRISAVAALLSPRAVAHIGASESGVYPSDIFRSLAASPVRLYAVNPRRSEVFGHPCFASVADIPEKADLAVLTIPAAIVSAALSDCVAAGIPNALVISSGFAEAGPAGRALQSELEGFGDRINILGPNCAGFANVSGGIVAARLYSRAAEGGISFVSQSGALMMALHGAFAERGAGLRAVVSVGNQAGFRLSDFLAHFASDAGTKVVAAFIEGMPDGGAFVDAARACFAAGKPVVAVKSGRTELGRRLAATHTAALAGEGRVFEAVCRQCGVILVDDIDALIATSRVASAFSAVPGEGGASDRGAGRGVGCGAGCDPGRIAWISQSGGLGSLAGDLAKKAGIEPSPYPSELGGSLNPVDVGGDATRGAVLGETLRPYLAHPDIDAAVILFAKNPSRAVEIETAKSLIAARAEHGKPIIVVWVGPAIQAAIASESADSEAPSAAGGASPVHKTADFSLDMLSRAGIPVFFSPGPAVRALSRLSAWSAFRQSWLKAGLGPDRKAGAVSGASACAGESGECGECGGAGGGEHARA